MEKILGGAGRLLKNAGQLGQEDRSIEIAANVQKYLIM